jgi:cytochrome c biogenesis protein CcmG/thiol:disulfide interchange protein DsbE
MRRFALPGLVALAAFALLALLAFGAEGSNPAGSIDAQVAHGHYPLAPSYRDALPVLNSKAKESLAQFHGQVVVLNVFASWCGPCRQEAPMLAKAESMLRAHHATVVGVTYLDNSSASAQFVKQEHINYPVLRDVSGNFVRSFGTTGVPETFIINRQGHIQAVRRYQLVGSWLKDTVTPILTERS